MEINKLIIEQNKEFNLEPRVSRTENKTNYAYKGCILEVDYNENTVRLYRESNISNTLILSSIVFLGNASTEFVKRWIYSSLVYETNE